MHPDRSFTKTPSRIVTSASTYELPTFPDRVPITLSHFEEIRRLTAGCSLYSDFNPTSLWAWSALTDFLVAKLHGNLVVEFGDYRTGDRFLSFAGSENPARCAHDLLDFAATQSALADELRLVPTSVALALPADRFQTVRDADARDYLYAPSTYESLEGRALRGLRQDRNRFQRAGSGTTEVVSDDLRSCDAWLPEIETLVEATADNAGERAALRRVLSGRVALAAYATLEIRVLLHEGIVRGFDIDERLDRNTILGHFGKVDSAIPRLATYMFLAEMTELHSRNVTIANHEQDLGIPGLRHFKKRLRPSGYLEKYTVTRRPNR